VGLRLKKTSGGQTTKYVGGNYQIAPDGTITKYLVGGKQVGTSFFAHHRDQLGSIQAVTNSAGTDVRRQKHKPFGDQHYVSGSHAESKGWIGEREEETELVYLNARYYDPEIGRFVSPDPVVALGQGLNRFSYAWNNPINLFDPLGLDPTEPEPDPGTDENNPAAICELNPSCRDAFRWVFDPSLTGWTSEAEESLVRRLEVEAQRTALTTVDCTQPGANCGPPPCAAYGTCPQDPQSGTPPRGGSQAPTLKFCEKHPDRCAGAAAAATAAAAGIAAGDSLTGIVVQITFTRHFGVPIGRTGVVIGPTVTVSGEFVCIFGKGCALFGQVGWGGGGSLVTSSSGSVMAGPLFNVNNFGDYDGAFVSTYFPTPVGLAANVFWHPAEDVRFGLPHSGGPAGFALGWGGAGANVNNEEYFLLYDFTKP
jgi:RHS repeat-associated protein